LVVIEEKVMIAIPIKKQKSDYDCGPAVLHSILSYFKVAPETYKGLIKACKTTKRNGTSPSNIIEVAKSYGLNAKEYRKLSINKLQKMLDDKKPVIIDIQAWGKEFQYEKLNAGHYAIAVGYDLNNVYLRDPLYCKKNKLIISKIDFLKRWKDKTPNGEILKQYAIAVWKK